MTLGLCAALLSGCGASWAGSWNGTADIGPVAAHPLTLVLSESGSTAQLASDGGEGQVLTICSKKVEAPKITLEIDTGRPDCTPGQGAKRLRLEGMIGAEVIHGDIYEGHERVGFFRAFRAAEHGGDGLASTPAPTAPASSTPVPSTGAPSTPPTSGTGSAP